MFDKFDVTVIGSGPGGYVCAIRLAQLGLKTACIDSRTKPGGTCLNIGCIPSKNLLNISENFSKAKNFEKSGIEIGELKLNLSKIMQNKDKAIDTLTKGVAFLLKKNKVTFFNGVGSLNEAEKSYKKAIEIKPDFAMAYNNLANTLRDINKLDEAEQNYKKH